MESHELSILSFGENYPQGFTDIDIGEHFQTWTLHEIGTAINGLSKKKLISFSKKGTTVIIKITKPDEILLIESLDTEEKIIYNLIKGATDKGIWIKDLKLKSNLHQNVLNKILKTLESRRIIKSVKSVKSGTKKVYMLYDTEPSTDVTGGPWFDGHEIDAEFVNALCKVAYNFILSKSFPLNPKAIFPSSYDGYATLEQIHSHISRSGFLNNIELSFDHISEILDVLIYEGRIERLTCSHSIIPSFEENDAEAGFYRALKSKHSTDLLMSLPCGNCPVFSLCSDFGPVTPIKCEYFNKWLQY